MLTTLLCAAALCGCSAGVRAQEPGGQVRMVAVQRELQGLQGRGAEWFKSEEGRRYADVVASWQNANGGWWKAYDLTRLRPTELPGADEKDGVPGDTASAWLPVSTFDNGATYTEMRILARAYAATGEERYKAAFGRGLEFVLVAQYANGGWPQRYPLQENYGRHITFNDGAMINVMRLLRDVAEGREGFEFVGEADRARCRSAVERGVECVLACQIRTQGKLTAWCQQHDEVTLAPAAARAYELPSIAAAESAGVALFLMENPNPDERVRRAVEGAVNWFKGSKITGKRYVWVTGPEYEKGRDRALVDDPTAQPIWGRFYDLETNRPFFCSRDGVKRWSVAEISAERRVGYAWFGNWGESVAKAYAEWQRRVEWK